MIYLKVLRSRNLVIYKHIQKDFLSVLFKIDNKKREFIFRNGCY